MAGTSCIKEIDLLWPYIVYQTDSYYHIINSKPTMRTRSLAKVIFYLTQSLLKATIIYIYKPRKLMDVHFYVEIRNNIK